MGMGRRGIADSRPVYIPWRRDLKKVFLGCIHNTIIGKGKAQIGRMDVILRDSHLDTRIKICILMNLIVPKLEYAGEVWQGDVKLVKKLETAQMAAAKKILGCTKTTSNTALRA